VTSFLRDIRSLRPSGVAHDLAAALAVTFMAVPQGIAYALIAGLPPIMGLYAATLPTIVGSLFRSSRHVVAGPTNAVSLVVGGAVGAASAKLGLPPEVIAVQLALLVGLMQVGAGVLRLGSIVDFISKPVVLGYITGAGVLIGVGQLPALTGSPGGSGDLFSKLFAWGSHLDEAQMLPLLVGLGVAAGIVGLRLLDRRLPGALLALSTATAASVAFELPARGLTSLGMLSPVPSGLPPLSLPGLPAWELLSLAAAATVLSLVESSAVARSLADKTGDTVNANIEFLGQGLANLAASVVGGYPVSGSLARSKLNHQAGAQSRLAGVFSGLLVVGVLLVAGPLVEQIPVAALAGLLLVVAWDLVDRSRIAMALHGSLGDKLALVITTLGTWVLPLDKAIYAGIAISIALFVRRASLLVVRELRIDEHGRLAERPLSQGSSCERVSILHVEGALFFGAAAELRAALDEVVRRPGLQVVVLRLRRTQGLDMTCTEVLASTAASLRAQGKTLILVGMREDTLNTLRQTGAADVLGEENLFSTRARWFEAMNLALDRAHGLSDDHAASCKLTAWLGTRLATNSSQPPDN
jgi:sulfate permease, SulP family